jgi:hypothetical protein
MLRILFAALTLVALSLPAEARRAHVATVACVDGGDNLRPCAAVYASPHFTNHATSVIAGGRPRAWCGWWMRQRLGVADIRGNVARWWAGYGRRAPGPGAGEIAVWPHHVGLITAVNGNKIMLLSGNDGNAVRERWRPTRGIIAYRFAS